MRFGPILPNFTTVSKLKRKKRTKKKKRMKTNNRSDYTFKLAE
jgi:hypothetical protein